jgi:hypothetical protein
MKPEAAGGVEVCRSARWRSTATATNASPPGARIPIDLRAKTPWDDDPGGESVVDAAVRWVIDAWRAVRHVAPELRGFISEHDGGEMIDLDSGQVVPDDQVAMGPR